MKTKKLAAGILVTGMIFITVAGCGQSNDAIITATKQALCEGNDYQKSGAPGAPGMGDACQTALEDSKWTYSVDAHGDNTATVTIFESGKEYGNVYLAKDNNGEWHSTDKPE